MKRNKSIIRGTIVGKPEFFMAKKVDEYYTLQVSVKRNSDVCDIIPVVVPRKTIDPNADYDGMRISLEGILQTIRQDGHLRMYVFSKKSEIYSPYEEEEDINEISFSGVLKNKVVRETGLRKIPIADIHILNWDYYYPCIVWGDNVTLVDETELGTKMLAKGRFQSRDYEKTDEDGEVVQMRAYEISLSKLTVEKDRTQETETTETVTE